MVIYETEPRTTQLSLSFLTVGVWGLGKMGLPLAAIFAENGATVLGVDIDPELVQTVNAGESPIENEPHLPELIAEHGGNKLTATTDGAEAASKVDVAIVLVPTVIDEDHEPILDPVIDSARDIAAGLDAGNLVILESTVPPGTTGGVFRDHLESSGLRAGEQFGLAFCPERTSSGRVIRDLTESYPKIVGGIDTASTEAAAAFYEQFNEPGVVSMDSTVAAEAVKVFEGVYRDVNIALANELAKACEQWGVDAHTIFDAANTQPYCDIHDPGAGVGGHCIPVYPHFVINQASDTPLLETARNVNTSMPEHTVAHLFGKMEEHDIPVSESSVLVLGLTYRPGVRELRYAPAVDIVTHLRERGVDIYAHDPLVDPEQIAQLGATPVTRPTETEGLNGVVLVTGHEAYADLDTDALASTMETPVFIDGQAFFDPEQLSEFDQVAIGRLPQSESSDV